MYKYIERGTAAKKMRSAICFFQPHRNGFQTFVNNSYDCWAITDLNPNLPSNQRFLLRNILPLGFAKGRTERRYIDTFQYLIIGRSIFIVA